MPIYTPNVSEVALSISKNTVRNPGFWLALSLAANCFGIESSDEVEDVCVYTELQSAGDDVTVGELRERCNGAGTEAEDSSLLQERVEREQVAVDSGSALSAYKQNYVLPATYFTNPNEEPYRQQFGDVFNEEQLNNAEIKFQLSLKFLIADGLLFDDDGLYLGFTSLSFWQAYNRDVSAPFRETNYEPEIFWTKPINWRPFNIDTSYFSLGAVHQSNGRGGALSRSWNRIYANFIWENDNFVFGFKPWWRVPEESKDDPLDASGDDNPDIEKFLGYFEFTGVYSRGEHEFSMLFRNNLRSDNKGAVQLDWTFPLWRNLRGYAQYFNGYGESLIDYNASIERIGLGIVLTDLL